MTTTKRVLILDDDANFAQTLAGVLPSTYQAKTVFSLKQAVEQMALSPFDWIVSDFILAEYNGFDFLKTLNTLGRPPKVVFMTAFANKEMAISLLNHGVHGLLEKPFSVSQLVTLLDKQIGEPPTRAWTLDASNRSITTVAGSIELTEVEFKIVSYVLSQAGQWISRDEIVEHVWGNGSTSRNVLDTHLTNLKRKVPDLRKSLKVVRGRGYCLENTPAHE